MTLFFLAFFSFLLLLFFVACLSLFSLSGLALSPLLFLELVLGFLLFLPRSTFLVMLSGFLFPALFLPLSFGELLWDRGYDELRRRSNLPGRRSSLR